MSRRTGLIALAVAVLLASGAQIWRVHSARAFFDERTLLSRFPAEDALALSVDVATLRRGGILGPPAATAEPEYRQFIEATGFDYRRDLDYLAGSFSRSGTYFIARGRFDWNKLRDYAARQGGSCYQGLCRLEGSRPERHISFLPLRSDALALAVSTDARAATLLTRAGPPVPGELPSAPAWISVPGAELRRQGALPPAMHFLLSALGTADRVVITFGPAATGIEARLEATCRTAVDANVLASQLRSTTALFKKASERDKQIAADPLAAVLTAGTFEEKDKVVIGKWPVAKNLISALTQGI